MQFLWHVNFNSPFENFLLKPSPLAYLLHGNSESWIIFGFLPLQIRHSISVWKNRLLTLLWCMGPYGFSKPSYMKKWIANLTRMHGTLWHTCMEKCLLGCMGPYGFSKPLHTCMEEWIANLNRVYGTLWFQ